MWVRGRATFVALSFALGCAAIEPASLVVDIDTDFVPGIEFREVETDLVAYVGAEPDGPTFIERDQPSFSPSADSTILRVARFDGITPGDYLVTVRLRAVDGLLIAETQELVSFAGPSEVARLQLTRGCFQVFCPRSGEPPENTRCRRGGCVPERCEADDPSCAPECESDANCAASSTCAEPRCVDGDCLQTPVHARCRALEWCDPDSGCRALDAPCSEESCVGGPCQDAQCVDGRCLVQERCAADELCCNDMCAPAGCSDADPCTADACGALGCEHTPLDEGPCDDGVYCNGPDECSTGVCDQHSGDPCSGSAVCEEDRGACVGCSVDRDCGSPVNGPLGMCDYTDECDTSASAERSVTGFSCVATVCSPSVSTQVVPCSRATSGMSCGTGGRRCSRGTCSCPGGTSESSCTDGADNDCDGLVDCVDPDCSGRACDDGSACTAGEVCSGASCGGGSLGRPVRRCSSSVYQMYMHVTDARCPSICGLADDGVVWREVPGQSAPTYQLGHTTACGWPTDCEAGYFISRNSEAGDGFYCDVGRINSAYAATNLPGTVPIYRYYDPDQGQYTGLAGTAPSPGHVRRELTRYVCPP